MSGPQKTTAGLDAFYESIFGKPVTRAGQGYERLVAAALKIAGTYGDVKHDERVRGTYSETVYQIDALVAAAGGRMVEAKDYTTTAGKVGRGDLQKLAGALADLPLAGGMIASATGFTRPSAKYATATSKNPSLKPIELVHVRPSVDEDERGRVKRLVVRISLLLPEYDQATWTPEISQAGRTALMSLYPVGSQVDLRIYQFVRPDGSVIATIRDLTGRLQPDWEKLVAEGTWTFDEPAYFDVDGTLVEISSVRYIVPYGVDHRDVVIDAEGSPRLLIRTGDGKTDRLITDEELRRVRFTDDGEVRIEGDE